jgi:hypothetical protein
MFYDYSLATERLSELHRAADDARVAHRLTSARRWARLATWAQDHASRASRHVG